MTEEEYQTALNNIADTFGTLTDQVNRAFEAGRKVGLNDMQIGNDVRMRIKGLVSTSTIQRMLPETAKHQEKIREPAAVKMTANPQPNIPPPPQVIQEVETEPPKPIDEPIHIPKQETIKIIFDPAMMDRNERSYAFLLHFNTSTSKITKYEMIARKSIKQ